MDLLKSTKVMERAFRNGFTRVKIKVRDYKNRCHEIQFFNDQDINEKVISMANLLGDGHIVISITIE